MKNHKLCLCALAALLLLLLMAGSAMASSGTFGVIYGTDTLNLRAQGSSSSQWLGSCTRGTWVEIQRQPEQLLLCAHARRQNRIHEQKLHRSGDR